MSGATSYPADPWKGRFSGQRKVRVLALVAVMVCSWSVTGSATAATLRASGLLGRAGCAVGPVGSGSVVFILLNNRCLSNPSVNCRVRYRLNYSNLSSNATGSHIHTVGAGGCAGGVVESALTVSPTTSGYISLTLDLSQAETTAIFDGSYVVDLHTVNNAGGELVGTVTKEPMSRVPTVSQWGLIAMTLVLLTAGTVVLVKGRQTRAAL